MSGGDMRGDIGADPRMGPSRREERRGEEAIRGDDEII